MTERERALDDDARRESDETLRQRFLSLPQLEAAQTVLLFAGMGREVDTLPLLTELERRGKQVLLPRCLPDHGMEARRYAPERLLRHPYGMLEPDPQYCQRVEPEEVDLILVPALCYDRHRFRMGRGGGYYDRYLIACTGFTVGLCRDRLLCDAVPREPWDRPVELVVTETEYI